MPPESKPRRIWAIVYFILLAAIFLLAAVKRFAGLPLVPFADKDLGGYLSPALSALAGRGFVLSNGRGFAYPVFVFWILRLAGGDFRAIAIVQHLLGLATGGLLLFSWNRARCFVARPAVPLPVHEALGLLLASTYLLFNWPILYEHRIRPEAVFPFFIALNIAFNIEFIRRRFLLPAKAAPFFLGTAIVFSAVLLYMLKPAWGFSLFFSSLPVWVAVALGKEPWWRRLLLVATPLFLAVALLLLPEKILERTDSMSEVFLPRLLFAMHGNLIRDQMLDDLASRAPVPYDTAWLASVAASLSTEIEKSKPGRRTLGFDPDYLIYQKGSTCDQIAAHFSGHPHEQASFLMYYYLRAAEKRPFAMAGKVLAQMGVFYSFNSSMYRSGPLDVAAEYRHSVVVLNGSSVSSSPLVAPWRARCAEWGARATLLRNGHFTKFILRLLRVLHVPLLAAAIILPAIVLSSGKLRGPLLGLALLDLLLYSYSFGNNLTVAIVHTLEVNRYVQNEFAFVLFLHFVTILLLVEICLRIREKRADRVTVSSGDR